MTACVRRECIVDTPDKHRLAYVMMLLPAARCFIGARLSITILIYDTHCILSTAAVTYSSGVTWVSRSPKSPATGLRDNLSRLTTNYNNNDKKTKHLLPFLEHNGSLMRKAFPYHDIITGNHHYHFKNSYRDTKSLNPNIRYLDRMYEW